MAEGLDGPREPSDGIWSALSRRVRDWECPQCARMRTTCSLSEAEGLPTVVFVGEADHGDPQVIRIRRELLQMAKEGKILLASEVGAFVGLYPWESTYPSESTYLRESTPGSGKEDHPPSALRGAYGLESPIPFAVGSSTNLLYKARTQARAGTGWYGPLESTIFHCLTSPVYASAIERIKPTVAAALPELSAYLTKAAKALESTLNQEQVVDYLNQYPFPLLSEQETIRFLSWINLEIVRIANTQYRSDLMGQTVASIAQVSDDQLDAFMATGDFIMVPVRNRDFAQQLGNLLCEGRKKAKVMVSLTGDLHVKGMRRYLRILSEGRIQTRYFLSSHERSLSELQKLLDSAQNVGF